MENSRAAGGSCVILTSSSPHPHLVITSSHLVLTSSSPHLGTGAGLSAMNPEDYMERWFKMIDDITDVPVELADDEPQ